MQPERQRLESLVRTTVESTAAKITEAGQELPEPFRERQLQDWFVNGLRRSLPVAFPELLPHGSGSICSIALPGWPGVGPVDVVLVQPEGTHHAFFELKWGWGTLHNCIWDLAKMGASVSLLVGNAYLLAGAPDRDWEHADGAECFSTGTHRLVDLFEQYPQHWRFWLNDVKTHPLFLPKLITTTEVATVPVQVRGKAWTMRCVDVSPAVGTAGWWEVGPLEEMLGIRIEPVPPLVDVPMEMSISDTPYPTEAEVGSAEDHRRFDRGDAEALWRLVHNPPSWWKFWWFPGDVDFVGKTLEEAWGDDSATLLLTTRSIKTRDDLKTARAAVEAFVGAHPGDPTAISAARDCVFAERHLQGEKDADAVS